MDVLSLQPFVPFSAFDKGKLNHLTFFFQHLAMRFGEFRQLRAVAQKAEVDRVARAVATRILVGIHNVLPHFPVGVVLEEPSVEDQQRAERAVADMVVEVVRKGKENNYGKA